MACLPIEYIEFDAARLIAEHPPRLRHPNKQAVYDVACSSGYPFTGAIRYTRWAEMELPQAVTAHSRISICADIFDYLPSGEGRVDWHVNFADPNLFFAYGSALLAQDELQAAEHPGLGSLREALLDMGKPALTMDADGRATPITITGVQRRVAFDTRPNPGAGRPHGLYGNAFGCASLEQVTAAAHPLSPPTLSNILAMAAPGYGHGEYTQEEIRRILATACTGFTAARLETKTIGNLQALPVVHTGFWGCGAFGGNRRLMTILQILAADLAGVEMVFHALDPAGAALAKEAGELYARILEALPSLPDILQALRQQGFQWGVSDGN